MPIGTDEAQGATGEPAGTPEAAGSASHDDAILGPLEAAPAPSSNGSGLDEDFLKKLSGLDPSKLPADVRAKLEAPFLSQFTKSQQQVSEQQKAVAAQQAAMTEALLRRLPEHVQQQPNVREQLLAEVKAGNLDAIDGLLQATVQQQVGPLQEQIAQQRAIQEAARLHPFITERENDVAAELKANPALVELVRANGFRNAPVILQGVAQAIELRELKAKWETEKIAYGKQVLEAAKRRAGVIPSRTSEAGSSQSGGPTAAVLTIKEAIAAAAAQHGLTGS